MSTYAWIIDKDLLEGAGWGTTAGTVGPRSAPDALVKQLNKGEGTKFRMLDDDRELYYEGRIIGEYEGFEPLDDFGTPNAGATEIQYKDSQNTWQPL